MEDKNTISSRILNSASVMFFKYGYSKSTADEIAREAGVSKRTMYKYYPGKSNILEHLIDMKISILHQQMQDILNSDFDFPEKLKKSVSTVTATLQEINRDFLDDIRKSVPEIWQKISDYKKELVEKYYTKILFEGKKSGHFKENINIGVAVLLMMNAMELILNPPAKGGLPEELEKHVPAKAEVLFDEVLELIYNGILAND
ncbi:MAG: TetR/AcrR family transcriptional regulator [Bacteroidetes bacterium]|nr:TetR/AcrR family transcriptional regulator [Bacteroidota bacterium]